MSRFMSGLHQLNILIVLAVLASCGQVKQETGIEAKLRCEEIAKLSLSPAEIGLPVSSVTLGPANKRESSSAKGYCQLDGYLHAMDPNAQPIHFQVNLPDIWNRKSLHIGGGGWNGYLVETHDYRLMADSDETPLDLGYVIYGSDSGHKDDPVILGASFMLNEEQTRNFGGDQLKKTHDAVQSIIAAYYDQKSSYRYFMGGSNGGREAMAVMQSWPEDYEGIVARYPAMAWTPLMLKLQHITRAFRADNAKGWLSDKELFRVGDYITSVCDPLDGLTDGLISNTAICRPDLTALKCGVSDHELCLTKAQLSTIRTIISPLELPYELANGVSVAPSSGMGYDFFVHTAIGHDKLYGADPNDADIGSIGWFADGMIRYGLFGDPDGHSLSFDPLNPGKYLPRLQELSRILDHTNPDIDRFKEKGGKVIIMHGNADELVGIGGTRLYYAMLQERYGATLTDFVRYYEVPGMDHGGRGRFKGVRGVQLFKALETWVEKGEAPDQLIITDHAEATAGRTRPLCLYPSWPRYRGKGDPNSHSSFECVF